MNKRLYQSGMLILICLFAVFTYMSPALAREKVTVLGEKMRHYVTEDQISITGNAQIATTDLLIRADEIQAEYVDGKVLEIKATGHVKMEKDGEVFEGKELTYHLEDKTGLILDMRGTSTIEESDSPAYLYGEKAYYTEDMIEIVNGSMTTCELDHPHYLFRAKRVEVYPEDKIRAYHLTFWEFNGKVPLFYWYRYTISLKDEEQHFTPKVGYNGVTGWFLKMTYSYFTDGEQHAEFYVDMFQKVGPAAGVKWWYMDHDNNEGSVYLYMQKPTETSNYPYLTLQHAQRYQWEALNLNTTTSLRRKENQDSFSNSTTLRYQDEGTTNYLQWSGTYSGYANYSMLEPREVWSANHALTNTVNGKLKLGEITFDGKYYDRLAYNYVHEEWNSIDADPWTGHLEASQRQRLLDWSLLAKKEKKGTGSHWLYTLPELSTKLKLSGVRGPLRPYLAPLSYELKLGHFNEIYYSNQVEGYRWYNQLNFRKQINLFNPFYLIAGTSGAARLYSTKEGLVESGEMDLAEVSQDIVYEYKPSLELRTRPIKGLTSSLKYDYHKATEGESPFKFDRLASKETKKVTGALIYNQYGLNINSNTSYDLINKTYGYWNNSLTYSWGTPKERSNIRLVVPYKIEDREFATMTGTMKLKSEDLYFGFGTSYNPTTKKIGKLDSELSWQVLENWHLNLVVAYDPNKIVYGEYTSTGELKKGVLEKGTLEITRDLHCRELSLSYDHLKKEIWLQYHIKAFPKQKFKFGSSDDDPMLFDADLGGILDGEE